MPPHPAAKSATSAAALGFPQTAVATRPRMAGEASGQAGSRDALARLNAAIEDLKLYLVQSSGDDRAEVERILRKLEGRR